MVALWPRLAVTPIRCLRTAATTALKSTFGPCDTGRCVACRHAKLLDDVHDVPAGSKFHRRLCLTGVSQGHMPCLQSFHAHLAQNWTCALGQPAMVIIWCTEFAGKQGKKKSAEQWLTAGNATADLHCFHSERGGDILALLGPPSSTLP